MHLRFLILVFVLVITNDSLFAQKEDQRITALPTNVLVYLNGAQINAKGSAGLKAGRQTIIFDKLSNAVDQNSVQIKADAAITILSVDYQLDYLDPQENKEYKFMNDSLDSYRKQLSRLAVIRRGYEEELSTLASNKSIGGANVGVSVNELQKMADFVRIRFQEAALKKLETEEKEKMVNERIALLSNQLNVFKNKESIPTGQVIVQIDAKSAGAANFELSYYAGNCGWTPSYDIRVKDVNSTADIVAKANVIQNTGQEWKNVKLSLSTGNPSRGNTKPMINPWWISMTEPMVYKTLNRYGANNSPAPSRADSEMRSLEEKTISSQSLSKKDRSVSTVDFTQINPNTTTNAIFDISIPYTIASNGKDHLIEIQEYKVDAKYSYFAIPKLDQDAFLVADLIGWDKSELLPGNANVYFENNYVGKTYFDARIVDDTLSFALGRDNNVTIKRKQVKDLNEKTSIIGNNKKITRSFQIDIKNTRKVAIEIELEDQIPLSNNAELTVELINSSDAIYDKETGKLTWKLKLNPGESRKLTFSYSAKYPKKYTINGL